MLLKGFAMSIKFLIFSVKYAKVTSPIAITLCVSTLVTTVIFWSFPSHHVGCINSSLNLVCSTHYLLCPIYSKCQFATNPQFANSLSGSSYLLVTSCPVIQRSIRCLSNIIHTSRRFYQPFSANVIIVISIPAQLTCVHRIPAQHRPT